MTGDCSYSDDGHNGSGSGWSEQAQVGGDTAPQPLQAGGNTTRVEAPRQPLPPLVSTDVSYCVTHGATDHEGKKWTDCRFRQLFYFENPMDEHTVMWADEPTMCWFGDAPASGEYWFEPRQEWRPVCVSHEMVASDNLPEHYVRALDSGRSVPGGDA